MVPLSLAQIAAWTGGTVAQGDPARAATRVHTDSRTVQAGDLFVALAGERFDAHDFVPGVAERGAAAVLVSRAPAGPLAGDCGVIVVPDPLAALQQLARHYRLARAAKVVAVTGSSGKTSTKEMIAAVLRRRFRVVATEGNLNNHIGVPLTLLRIADDTEYAVVELGMNHRGEIAALAALALPDAGVVTTAGSAHIENLGSRAAIADEKTDLLAGLPPEGTAIINADDPLLRERAGRARGTLVPVGFAIDAAWRADAASVHFTPEGIAFILRHGQEEAPVRLPLFSRVMVANALLAAAVGGLAGLSLAEIAAGLETVRLVGKRMEIVPRHRGWIINDCYNANAESMRAALCALREFPAPARRVAVLGSMGELGAEAPALHREVGAAAAASGAALLILVGPHAADLQAGAREAGFPADRILLYATTAEAAAHIAGYALPDDTLLVKGSRFLQLEHLVAALDDSTRPLAAHSS